MKPHFDERARQVRPARMFPVIFVDRVLGHARCHKDAVLIAKTRATGKAVIEVVFDPSQLAYVARIESRK